MTNILLASILGATILLAGVFAVMPVEKASTVHTTILANTIELKVTRCAEVVNMAAGNDDGTFTLNLDDAVSNMAVVDIQLEAGATPFDANDTLTIDELDIDGIRVGTAAAISVAQTIFDLAPLEGDIKNIIGVGEADYYANDTVEIAVTGAVATNTSDYTIIFYYLAPGNDADAACDVALE